MNLTNFSTIDQVSDKDIMLIDFVYFLVCCLRLGLFAAKGANIESFCNGVDGAGSTYAKRVDIVKHLRI